MKRNLSISNAYENKKKKRKKVDWFFFSFYAEKRRKENVDMLKYMRVVIFEVKKTFSFCAKAPNDNSTSITLSLYRYI